MQLPVGAVFVEAHADGARSFGRPPVLGALQAAGKLFCAWDGTKHQGRAALRAIHPVQVIGPLTKGIWLRHGSGAPHISDHRRVGSRALFAG
jgi:hypothetical protein